MAHTIVDKSKLTVTAVKSTLDDIAADVQTSLRGATFANGDIIIDIKIERNKTTNLATAYIVWEDQ